MIFIRWIINLWHRLFPHRYMRYMVNIDYQQIELRIFKEITK